MRSDHEADSSAEPEDITIPDHELIQRIGRGSYGEVWLARNLMGYRAVKIVYRKSFQHQRPFERELAGIKKFEPISRSHESFVDILHVGQNETAGYFYYIMELGDDMSMGQSINPRFYVPKTLSREAVSRGRLPLSECVQLGLSLSAALDSLHTHGLVHRDVKPSNIIFVNGVPKLADIGLVADINEARSYVGTEGFIPPEGPGSAQADIYSLGKVLYEISTGRDRHDFPELPTRLGDTSDLDQFLELNEVMLRASANDLGKRYQSASDMHADLLLLAQGKSVKRLKLLEKRIANLKRIAGISAVTLAASAAILWQVYREWNFAREARQRQIGSEVAYGTRAMEEGDLLNSLPSFAAALHLDHDDPAREKIHRLRLRAVLAQSPKLVQAWFSDRVLDRASFAPDGKRVVIAEHLAKARVFDTTTGKPVSPAFGQSDGVVDANWHPGGEWIVTASYDTTVCVWNANTGMQSVSLSHPDRVLRAVFSPDGSRIATACIDKVARIWNLSSAKVEHELRLHTQAVLYAGFSHNGKLVVTTSRDNTAQIWNVATGTPIGPPLRHGSWVNRASFSPDDRKLVTAGLDHSATVWDVESSQRILPELKHGDAVMNAEFSPDGLTILTACLDGSARLWDVDSMQPLVLNPILRQSSRVVHATFAPDGHRIVMASTDGTTYLWDLAGNGAMPATFTGVASQDGSRLFLRNENSFRVIDTTSLEVIVPPVQLESAPVTTRLSRNGRFAIVVVAKESGSGSTNEVGLVWDCSSGLAISPPIALTSKSARLSISDDGKQLVMSATNGAQLWSVPEGQPVGSHLLHDETIIGSVLSPDKRRLALFGENSVTLWDTSSGKRVCAPLRRPLLVSFVEFSPDSFNFVTCHSDGQLTPGQAQVWDAATGKAIGHPLDHRDGVLCAAFSRDGQRIITGGEDFSAIIWDPRTGEPIGSPLHHGDQVLGVAFSPDGRLAATTSADGTARVWDAASGEPLTPSLRQPGVMRFTGFSSDGWGLVTASITGYIARWDLHPEQRSTDDLRLLSGFLTGFQSSASKSPGPHTLPERQRVWEKLRGAFPTDTAVSQEEILAWNSRSARYSQKQHHWAAAVFHLNHLVQSRPHDAELLRQLEQAQKSLSEEEHR